MKQLCASVAEKTQQALNRAGVKSVRKVTGSQVLSLSNEHSIELELARDQQRQKVSIVNETE